MLTDREMKYASLFTLFSMLTYLVCKTIPFSLNMWIVVVMLLGLTIGTLVSIHIVQEGISDE